MKKRGGFLLIELMVSLVALSFLLCLFGQFFSSIINWHRQAYDRLDVALLIQNHIEKIWHGTLEMSTEKSLDQKSMTHVPLPLPTLGDGLIMPKLKYGMIQCRKSNGSVIVQLPGYYV